MVGGWKLKGLIKRLRKNNDDDEDDNKKNHEWFDIGYKELDWLKYHSCVKCNFCSTLYMDKNKELRQGVFLEVK